MIYSALQLAALMTPNANNFDWPRSTSRSLCYVVTWSLLATHIAAAKSYTIKVLRPRESSCKSITRSWQSVGTFSSAKLIYWRPKRTTSFQRLRDLPRGSRHVPLVEWSSGHRKTLPNQWTRRWRMVRRLFGFPVLRRISLLETGSDQWMLTMILRAKD